MMLLLLLALCELNKKRTGQCRGWILDICLLLATSLPPVCRQGNSNIINIEEGHLEYRHRCTAGTVRSSWNHCRNNPIFTSCIAGNRRILVPWTYFFPRNIFRSCFGVKTFSAHQELNTVCSYWLLTLTNIKRNDKVTDVQFRSFPSLYVTKKMQCVFKGYKNIQYMKVYETAVLCLVTLLPARFTPPNWRPALTTLPRSYFVTVTFRLSSQQ